VGLTTPAVHAYEYCRTDVSSSMPSCGFSRMKQCQAMSSGRGGTCERDPFSTRSAYAYQPKRTNSRRGLRPVNGEYDLAASDNLFEIIPLGL
jgi:hypothetical protein